MELCIRVIFVFIFVFKAGYAKRNAVEEASAQVCDMSVHAQQTLLDLKDDLKLSQLRGPPIPLYRTDLPRDYIAYWQLQFVDQYIIISAGPDTGDHDLVSSGPLPPPTVHLVTKSKSTCHRFYMLTPGGQMMCLDEGGQVAATNLPDYVFRHKKAEPGRSPSVLMTDAIKGKFDILRKNWESHAKHIHNNMHVVIHSTDQQEKTSNTKFEVLPVIPDHRVQVAISDSLKLKKQRIHFLEEGHDGNRTVLHKEKLLCQVIRDCSIDQEGFGSISKQALKIDNDTGLHYLHLELLASTQHIFKGAEFIFSLELVYENNKNEVRHYGVMYKNRRLKRAIDYEEWSTYQETSIELEDKFPNYNQFDDDDCPIGCGPVAWAMVFSYLDRRSHANSSRFPGGQDLYRNGENGTTGDSSEIAPTGNDERMKGYIMKLNDLLGTFCLFESGATLMWDMNGVSDFFKDRQTAGSPKLIEQKHILTIAGVYNKRVAAWIRSRISDGWPVIIGWRVGSSSAWSVSDWHYPVATKFRQRTRKYKTCFWGICSEWRTETEYDMYLHQGWGGYLDGWKKMEAFYAITATY